MQDYIDLINQAISKDLGVDPRVFKEVMDRHPITITQPIIDMVLNGQYEKAKMEFNSLL